jgi:hypothetical protein
VVSALSAEQQVALTVIGTRSVLQHLNVVLLQCKTVATLVWATIQAHSADRSLVIATVITSVPLVLRSLMVEKITVK